MEEVKEETLDTPRIKENVESKKKSLSQTSCFATSLYAIIIFSKTHSYKKNWMYVTVFIYMLVRYFIFECTLYSSSSPFRSFNLNHRLCVADSVMVLTQYKSPPIARFNLLHSLEKNQRKKLIMLKSFFNLIKTRVHSSDRRIISILKSELFGFMTFKFRKFGFYGLLQ